MSDDNEEMNINYILPFNIRINSDITIFYDFVNFYFHKFSQKVNVYIKKFYGETELYECNADSINIQDLSILTTPISNCKNKTSIFNRIFTFDGTKLISGYLGHNSYFDIFLDSENAFPNDIIKIPPMLAPISNFASKYLKKIKNIL